MNDDEIAAAMAASPEPGEARELFVAAVQLLHARQRGAIPAKAWERLWNAADALLDQQALQTLAEAA